MANIILGNTQLPLPANTGLSATTSGIFTDILSGLPKDKPNTLSFFFANGPEHTPTMDSPLNYADEIGIQTNTIPIEFKFEKNIIGSVKECFETICNTPIFKSIQLHVTAACCKCMNSILVKGKKAIAKEYTIKQVEAELKLKVPFKGVEMQLKQELSDDTTFHFKNNITADLRKTVAADKNFDASILSSYNKHSWPTQIQTYKSHSQVAEDILGEMHQIVVAVIDRYQHRIKSNFVSTITEEILRLLYSDKCGIQIWDEVKKRSEYFWQSPGKGKKSDNMGHQFLHQIEAFGKKYHKISINVICHSAGAIAGCEFIKAVTGLRSSAIEIDKIIFLAPACTFKLFEDSIMKVRALQQHFRMFTMKDQYEQADIFVEGAYTQSPLYLASGLLEDKYYPWAPILGLEKIRRIVPHDNNTITSIHSFLEGYSNSGKVVYAVTNKRDIPTGHECTATSHEGFLQDPATIASIIEILNNGMKPPPLSALVDGNGPTNGQINGPKTGTSTGKGKPVTLRKSEIKSSGPVNDNYLKITVTKWKNESNKLEFSAVYCINKQISSIKNFKKVNLLTDVKGYYDLNLLELEETTTLRTHKEEYLHRMGMHFYDELFPLDLRKLIWKLRNKISTLIIDSFDEFIAWEYCKMSGKDTNGIIQNGPFLCEWFNFVRGFTDVLKEKISLKEMTVISPNSNLENSHTEKEMLFKLAVKHNNIKVTEIIPTIEEVITALRSGKYNGIHFIGHINSHEYATKFRLELDNGDITPEYLSGDTANLGKAQPFVFLNSCYSGKTGLGLTAVGGWAAAFLRAGASCFIGSTRAISDVLALKFATSFYQYLFDGHTVAEATKHARLDIKLTGDPSWLYYVVYAHPFAKLE
jgi:hypothetical protein